MTMALLSTIFPDGKTIIETAYGDTAKTIYNALSPLAYLGAFAILVKESLALAQGHGAAYMLTVVRVAVAAMLLLNLHTMLDGTQNVFYTVAQQVSSVSSSDILNRYQTYMNASNGPKPGGISLLDFASLENIGYAIIKWGIWCLGFFFGWVTWVMSLLQKFLLVLEYSLAPIFIMFWLWEGTRDIGIKYFLRLTGLCLWPIGWMVGNIVTHFLLSKLPTKVEDAQWLSQSLWIFVICGGWMVINALMWPAMISRALLGHGGVADALTSAVTTPMTVASSVAGIAATMASGGAVAPAAAAVAAAGANTTAQVAGKASGSTGATRPASPV
jgi:hypothetical protein